TRFSPAMADFRSLMLQLRYAMTDPVVVLPLAGCQRTTYDSSSNASAGPEPLAEQPAPSADV
ncbi:hypothetical protein AB9F46_36355, partial [Rhizobium leguminosarum]